MRANALEVKRNERSVMTRNCKRNRYLFQKYEKHTVALNTSETVPKHILNLPQAHPKTSPSMFQNVPKHASKPPQTRGNTSPSTLQKVAKHVPKHPQTSPKTSPNSSQNDPKRFPKRLRTPSETARAQMLCLTHPNTFPNTSRMCPNINLVCTVFAC